MRWVDNVREGALSLKLGLEGYGLGMRSMEIFGGGRGNIANPVVLTELISNNISKIEVS